MSANVHISNAPPMSDSLIGKWVTPKPIYYSESVVEPVVLSYQPLIEAWFFFL